MNKICKENFVKIKTKVYLLNVFKIVQIIFFNMYIEQIILANGNNENIKDKWKIISDNNNSERKNKSTNKTTNNIWKLKKNK